MAGAPAKGLPAFLMALRKDFGCDRICITTIDEYLVKKSRQKRRLFFADSAPVTNGEFLIPQKLVRFA